MHVTRHTLGHITLTLPDQQNLRFAVECSFHFIELGLKLSHAALCLHQLASRPVQVDDSESQSHGHGAKSRQFDCAGATRHDG